MAGFGSGVSMRKPQTFDAVSTLSRLESDEPLPDDDPRTRNGGLDPSRQADLPQIQFYAQARQSGVLSDKAWEKLIQRNPNAATLFSAVGVNPDIAAQQQRKQVLGQHFSTEQTALPESPMTLNVPGGTMEQVLPGREAVPAKADVQGAVLALLSKGDTAGAKELLSLQGQQNKDSPFAKINPKDYTPESVARFEKTNRYADLVIDPNDPERADKTLNHAKALRGEFNDLSKPFREVRDSFGRIQESTNEPSAAGDLALIFNYMKMLDPGSTVREGEFATAQNSAGIPERVRAMYNKSISGERLTDATRKDFFGRAEKLYERQKQTHKKLESQYSALAKRAGVDTGLVVTDFELEPMKPKDVPKDSAASRSVKQQLLDELRKK